ncbi:hypothetical protein [Emticicia sp. BO119]|uniref:hypothetical protein n=1 Tax=Emticicia sp. BO119 TaxID=2757768 RepID=UPI0015F0C6EF|nr:hypothetical protein [Emticicia sp. BO119]MBA4852293.1 hypothetical protein [Emticicia sp. BO119]
MLARLIYIILFLSLSGLLFSKERRRASHLLTNVNGIRTTASKGDNTPPSADDIVTKDFRTNYYFVRVQNDKPDDLAHAGIYSCSLLKNNALSGLFVQKTLNFFKSRSIYLLNCIWLI